MEQEYSKGNKADKTYDYGFSHLEYFSSKGYGIDYHNKVMIIKGSKNKVHIKVYSVYRGPYSCTWIGLEKPIGSFEVGTKLSLEEVCTLADTKFKTKHRANSGSEFDSKKLRNLHNYIHENYCPGETIEIDLLLDLIKETDEKRL